MYAARMDIWSPVRSQPKRGKTGKARGGRRKAAPGIPGDPDSVLSDVDAAHAAAMARTARQGPGEPAWRRFGSAPVTGRPGLAPDDPDTIIPLAKASAAGNDAIMGISPRPGDQHRTWDEDKYAWGSVPDGGRYGTGRAYIPAAMRRPPVP